ncbi:hypothetical protein PMAYCL1PPCAC_20016, partial [Pristionchus mayeri]
GGRGRGRREAEHRGRWRGNGCGHAAPTSGCVRAPRALTVAASAGRTAATVVAAVLVLLGGTGVVSALRVAHLVSVDAVRAVAAASAWSVSCSLVLLLLMGILAILLAWWRAHRLQVGERLRRTAHEAAASRRASSSATASLCSCSSGGLLAQFSHQRRVLVVHAAVTWSSSHLGSAHSSAHESGTGILAITRDVTSASARDADDARRDVLLIRALPRLVVVRATVGAARARHHVLRTHRAVEQRQLSQLERAQVVLTVGHLAGLRDDRLDLIAGDLDAVTVWSRHVRVQRLVLARERLTVLPRQLALLDRALASDDNLRPALSLERLQRIAPGADEQSDEVEVRVVVLRYPHLVERTNHGRATIIRGRLVLRVEREQGGDLLVTQLLQLLPLPHLARVQPLAVRVVHRLGRGTPAAKVRRSVKVIETQFSRRILNFQLH